MYNSKQYFKNYATDSLFINMYFIFYNLNRLYYKVFSVYWTKGGSEFARKMQFD